MGSQIVKIGTMATVSSFLNDLETAVGGPDKLREAIGDALGGDAITSARLCMWRKRGIPFPVHTPLRKVCAKYKIKPDEVAWRTVERSAA